MMKPVSVLSKNYLDKNCTLTFSSGAAQAAYLYDQKPATQWASSGSSDAVTESITVQFKDAAGNAALRTIDRIVLLNTNVKQFSASYTDADGVSHTISEAAISGNTKANLTIELATPVAAASLTLNAHTTMTANAEKAIGELKACALVLELSRALTEFSREDEASRGSKRMKNGDLVTWREWVKFGGTLAIKNLERADKETLLACWDSGYITIVYATDAAQTFLHIAECWIENQPNYKLDRRTGLYEVSLELKEI